MPLLRGGIGARRLFSVGGGSPSFAHFPLKQTAELGFPDEQFGVGAVEAGHGDIEDAESVHRVDGRFGGAASFVVHVRRTEPVDQFFQLGPEGGEIQTEGEIAGLVQRVPDVVGRRGRPFQFGAVLKSGDEAPRRRSGVAGKEQIVRQAQSFPLPLGERLGLGGGAGFSLLLEKPQQQIADAPVGTAQMDVKTGIRAQQPAGSP